MTIASDPVLVSSTPSEPRLAPSTVARKLDLACGQRPQAGFEGLDIFEGAQHRWNLAAYPWRLTKRDASGVAIGTEAIADSSILELHCSHYIEHIPMEYVDDAGEPVRFGTPGARDSLFRFFDECYRILIPGGHATIVCPANRSDRADWDPTHRRRIAQMTFGYLWIEWRKANALDHYNIQCNFAAQVGFTQDKVMETLHPEAAQYRYNHLSNIQHDWVVKLTSLKPAL